MNRRITSILLILLLISYLVISASAAPIAKYDCIGIGYDSNGDCTAIFNDLIAIKKLSKWGFADLYGNIKISCQYDEVKAFRDGYAQVKINSKWGIIDSKGKVIIKVQYDEVPLFKNGLFTVFDGQKSLQYDKDGNVFDLKTKYPGYDYYARLSSEYIAVAKQRDDGITASWGIIDSKGKKVILPQYPTSIYGMSLAPVLINGNGLFTFMENLKENADEADSFGGGIVDKSGKIILPFEYECWSSPPGLSGFLPYFSDGLALVQNVKDGKTSYIDRNGKLVFTLSQKQPVTFGGPETMESQLFNFSEGMCRIATGYTGNSIKGYSMDKAKWGFIDRTGKTIISPRYDQVSDYINGYAAVKKNGKMGIINKKGTVTIPIVYDYNIICFENKENFKNGMIALSKAGKFGVVNSSGKTVLPFIYDSPPSYNSDDGLFVVKKGNKYGFVDKNNQVIIQIIYQGVSHYVNNMAKVELGYKYGYINKNSKVVVPINYSTLSFIKSNRIYAEDNTGTRYLLDLAGKVIIKANASKVID